MRRSPTRFPARKSRCANGLLASPSPGFVERSPPGVSWTPSRGRSVVTNRHFRCQIPEPGQALSIRAPISPGLIRTRPPDPPTTKPASQVSTLGCAMRKSELNKPVWSALLSHAAPRDAHSAALPRSTRASGSLVECCERSPRLQPAARERVPHLVDVEPSRGRLGRMAGFRLSRRRASILRETRSKGDAGGPGAPRHLEPSAVLGYCHFTSTWTASVVTAVAAAWMDGPYSRHSRPACESNRVPECEN
jgi:hypothetical protein